MTSEQAVMLARQTLEAALWVGAPLLIVVTVVGLVISVGQAVTSLQDATLSTVPRLAAVAVALFLLLPWMLRRLVLFTVQLFSDLRPYAQ